jgi:hypothetical protein
MFKMRVALLGAMTLLVVSGFAASTASAAGPYWHVGGSGARFEKGATGLKLQLKGKAVLAVPSAGFSVECNGSISESSTINGNGTNQGQDKGQLTFSSCKTTLSGCTVAEPITTNQTKSFLANSETTQTKIVDVFAPEKGEAYVVLNFSSGCGLLAGAQTVKGRVAAEIIPAGVELKEGILNFPTPSISSVKHEGTVVTTELKVGGLVSTFSATYGARLESGANFGVTET